MSDDPVAVTVRCASRPKTDWVKLVPGGGHMIDLKVKDTTSSLGDHDMADVTLNEEGARCLFNALGIWLHLPKG